MLVFFFLTQKSFTFCFLILFFGCVSWGILLPEPRIRRAPPALEMQNLKHWTSREVPKSFNCYMVGSYYHFFLFVNHFSVFIEFGFLVSGSQKVKHKTEVILWDLSMWNPSSLTRDQTHTPCTGTPSLNPWTTSKVPKLLSVLNQDKTFRRMWFNINIIQGGTEFTSA